MRQPILFIIIIVSGITNNALSQVKYPHRYFDSREYNSGRKVYCLDQAENGLMFMGTTSALVRYDGERWKQGIVPGGKTIYWLDIDDNEERVYVGSAGEFGYFTFDLTYYSLSDRLDSLGSDFGVIWELDVTTHGAYFRSSEYIFWYRNDSLSTIDGIGPSDAPFDVSFNVRDTIYTRIRQVGIATIYDGKIDVIADAREFDEKSNSFVRHPNGVMIATRSDGLFLYSNGKVEPIKTDADRYFKTHKIYHAIALESGEFAFATLTGGVVILGEDGTVNHSIKKANYGIHEGTGYVFEDNRNGLWVGLDKGMIRVDLAGPIRVFNFDEVAEYDEFSFHDGRLYFGSFNGLYAYEESSNSIKKVSNFPNLVSNIFKVGARLFATDLTNTYEIEDLVAFQAFHPKVQALLPIEDKECNYLGGGQEGLVLLQKTDKWRRIKVDSDAPNNVLDLHQASGDVWGISSTSGLFRYEFGKTKVYPLNKARRIKHHHETMIVTSEEGFFVYNRVEDRFVSHTALNDLLPGQISSVHDFFSSGDSTWTLYYNQNRILTGDLHYKGKLVQNLPLFEVREQDQAIIELDRGMLIIGNNDNIFRYNPAEQREVSVAANVFSEVLEESKNTLHYSQAPLRLDFATSTIPSFGENYYRYKIDGYNTEWSDWNEQNYMEITNLLEGEYTLTLQAMTPYRELVSTSQSFIILPPWYRTYLAYTSYLLFLGLVIWGFVQWRSRYLHSERKKLEKIVRKRTKEIIEQKGTIEQSLKEREALIREIHHRVKNNLQVISSIFNMQLKEAKTKEMTRLIYDGQSRVKAMSLIHQKLYQNDKLDKIEFEDYVRALVNEIDGLYRGSGEITCEIVGSGINLDLDTAIPLGLILNELLSNSYKYAFQDSGRGKITIHLSALKETQYLLEYSDDGIGFPGEFELEEHDSLGLKLVSILTRQLKGKLKLKKGRGARFSIDFESANG